MAPIAQAFRKDVMATVSVVGLACNLLGSLGPLLTLTNWARYFVENWIYLTAFIWKQFFHYFHVDIPTVLGFALTLLVFHIGLLTSALPQKSTAATSPEEKGRDRLIAIFLYLPILIGTLSTAFASLSADIVASDVLPNQTLVVISFLIVLASPIMVFVFARPRAIVRRFVSVYMVAATIVLLDAAARYLEGLKL
jgi:hypothetical protein